MSSLCDCFEFYFFDEGGLHVKDSENIGDNKKIKNSEEDLSLAELLGTEINKPQDVSPRRAAEGRPDEPSSGLVRLSAMIASASAEQAKIPSEIPLQISARPESTPTGGVHYSAPPPQRSPSVNPPAPQAKANMGWLVVVVAIVAAAGVGYALLRPSSSAISVDVAALEKQIAELKAAQAQGGQSAAEAKMLKAKLLELEAVNRVAAPVPEEPKAATAEKAKTEQDRDSKAAAMAQPLRPAKKEDPAPRDSKPAASTPNPAATPSSPAKEESAAAPPAAKPATEELDSLLGKKKEDPKPEQKKESSAGGIPSQPDRAAVQQAMGPVISKA
jgi:hypothetical protein